MSNNSSIIKSTGIVSLGTVISRITGFVRDVLIAKFFGTGDAISAFVVAFRIPNTLRELVGEGASNAAFVPVFSEYLPGNRKEELWKLVNILFIILVIGLSLITLLGMVFSPLIVRLIAPGFTQDPQKLLLTVKLARMMFPYIFLIGLTAYVIGILYTFKNFLTPAFGPILLNISLISATFLSFQLLNQPIFGLAVAVLIGGLLQLSFQLPSLFKIGFSFKYNPGMHGLGYADLKRIGRLLIPRTIASAVYQLNVFVDTIFASLFWLVGRGAVSAIFYANRLIQFPLAVFSVAISNVILPTMSQLTARDDLEGVRDILSFSLRMIFLILIPVTIGICILSVPITKVFFQRGAFGVYSTRLTSQALFFYSLGILAFGANRVLINGFYSLKDTLSPLKAAISALLANIILNIILIKPMKIGGLALASSISASLNLFILYFMLRKKIGRLNEVRILTSLFKILSAALVMGVVLMLVWKNLFPGFLEILRLAITISIGVVVFIFCCAIIKIEELKQLRWILKKD